MTRRQRLLNLVTPALAAAALFRGDLASQLVTDVEPMEACEVLRLGDRVDVPEWLAFVSAPSLMLDAAGRVYVRAGQVASITVLAADGSFVRTIGGKGEGPGEFVVIRDMGFAGDTLWLQNWPALHISYFDSAGTYLKTETDRGPPPVMPSLWRTSVPLAGGRGFYIPAGGNHGQARVRVPMTVGTRSDESRDTLAFKFDITDMRIAGVGLFNYSATTTPPIHRIDPEGNGVVIADWVADRPDVVTVRHFDEHGRLARERSIGAELRPIPSGVKRELISEGVRKAEGPMESSRQRGEQVPGNLRAAVEDGLLLPDYHAPIQGMLVTRTGRVWLRETSTPDVYEGQWVVLGPDCRTGVSRVGSRECGIQGHRRQQDLGHGHQRPRRAVHRGVRAGPAGRMFPRALRTGRSPPSALGPRREDRKRSPGGKTEGNGLQRVIHLDNFT